MVVFLITGVLLCNIHITLIHENHIDLYMRDLGIETEVTVGFHLMGNRFQINFIPKSIMINNVFIITFVDRITLRYAE